MRICTGIKTNPFFVRKVNATGTPQSHHWQNVAAALRVMCYGETYDRADEYLLLSRSTIQLETTKLAEFMVSKYTAF